MRKILLPLAFIFFFCLSRAIPAAPGDLDASFGAGGKVVFTDNTIQTHALALQADGKILVAGYAVNNSTLNYDFFVARYHPSGALDQSFGANGRILTGIGAGDDFALAIAVQPDGKILVAGNARLGNQNNFALLRCHADGTLDRSFDGDGKTITSFGDGSAFVQTLILQTDGKILVGGGAEQTSGFADFALARYNADGSLDNTFDADGRVLTAVGADSDIIKSAAVQPDGKIVVAGSSGGIFVNFAVVRYHPNGSTDSAFGTNGKVVGSFRNSSVEDQSLAVQADGKIVLAGSSGAGEEFDIGVARLNPDGSFDAGFDGDGIVITQNRFSSTAKTVRIQTNGKIVVGGSSDNVAYGSPGFNRDYAVVRYNPDGSLDASFGTGGKVVTDVIGGVETISSFALQPDGKIIAVGAAGLVRYQNDIATNAHSRFDFDGDGKADLAVFRPSDGIWYRINSANNGFIAVQFGANGDLIAPSDYDGDGKTDICVFRPSDGVWYRLNSSNNTFSASQFGTNGDLPASGDFDGDAKADIAVYRPSAGSWYRINSSNNQFVAAQFGIAEDKPLVGDFDGDDKSDLAVFRPSNGTWYRINSGNNTFSANQFGTTGDLPVAADYDGDGKTDLAVYRHSVGDWYIINSSNSSFTGIHFGITEDKPAPADFDGDGKADLVVFRPSSGTWYLLRTAAGFTGAQFGASGDTPVPNAFVR